MANEIEADEHEIQSLLGWDSDYDITTAAHVRGERGIRKDIQGIIWERNDFDRQKFRKARLEQYEESSDSEEEEEEESSESEEEEEEEEGGSSESDESLSQLQAKSRQLREQWKSSDKGIYYDFWQYTRLRITHNDVNFSDFIWATSKHDVYTASDSRIKHWSALTLKLTDLLKLEGRVVPSESHPGNIMEGFTATDLQTMSVGYNLLIVTGTDGELILKRLDKAGVSCCFQMPIEEEEEKRKINAVDIYKHHSGGIKFMTANEESSIKHFNAEPFHLLDTFNFPWPVNHTSVSPDGNQVVVVGNHREGLLVDSETGQTTATLRGHTRRLYASAWHPDGHIFATGSRDKRCRIWDVRNLSESVAVLKGNLGTIRSIRFSSDGQYMAMAESADFVHLYDVQKGFEKEKEQEIDFFGVVSGISFSPDTESLFIGVTPHSNPNNTHILWYNRHRNYYQGF